MMDYSITTVIGFVIFVEQKMKLLVDLVYVVNIAFIVKNVYQWEK